MGLELDVTYSPEFNAELLDQRVILRALRRAGVELSNRLRDMILALNLVDTGQLINSIKATVLAKENATEVRFRKMRSDKRRKQKSNREVAYHQDQRTRFVTDSGYEELIEQIFDAAVEEALRRAKKRR